MSLAQAGDHPRDLPRLHIHHLHLRAVGDIEALGRRVHRQIVPVARAADDPRLLDEERAARQFGGRGRLLRRQSGATQQAKDEQSLHREQLLMSRCETGGHRSSFFQFQMFLDLIRNLVVPTSWSAVLWISRPIGDDWQCGRSEYSRSGDPRYISLTIYG